MAIEAVANKSRMDDRHQCYSWRWGTHGNRAYSKTALKQFANASGN